MAIGVILEFTGITSAQYDAVNKALGVVGDKGWPKGLVSHVAGKTSGGWLNSDVWKSQAAFDKFASKQLLPAARKAGITLPPPKVTPFEVYNSYRAR